MKKHITFGFSLFLLITLSHYKVEAQFHNQWPFSIAEGNFPPGFGASLLDFNDGQVNVIGPDSNYGYSIGLSSGFICDSLGQLTFSSNGCALLNSDFIPFEELDPLTSPKSFELCPTDYGGFQKTVMAPDLTDPSRSLLIYNRNDYDEDTDDLLISTHLFLTVVSKKHDSLEVIIRQDTLRKSRALYDGLAMIPHASKPAWWVIELSGFGTNGWLTYLVSKDTVEYFPEQFIGPEVTLDKFQGSQITFSPDGRKITILDQEEGVFIFDFDRSTGKLSNMRNYQAPWMSKTDSTILDGTCFSINSEILYISNSRAIYQLIEGRPQPFIQVVDIQVEPGAYSNFPVFVGEMQIGPDCRIYVSPRAISGHMSVIHHPNRIGPHCGFEYKALLMPTMIHHQAPSTTFYHLGLGTSLCDSTIRWLSTSTRGPNTAMEGFDFVPNPAVSEFRLTGDFSLIDFPIHMRISDLTGKVVSTHKIRTKDQAISIGNLVSGVYIVSLRDNERHIGSSRLTVTR